MRLIDAEALDDEMYRKSFEVDDGRNVWNNGLWIRYKIYEETIKDAPTVEAIPVEWIKKYEKYDDLAASIYRMLEAWGVDMSDDEEREAQNNDH